MKLNAQSQDTVTKAEAEILIYLMPASKELRRQGFAVGWDVREKEDAFSFFVYNAARKCSKGCSVTVGYFSVNKHTAEVTDLDQGKRVRNNDIEAVQKIIKMAHGTAPTK